MSGTSVYFKGKWQSQTFTSDGTFTVPAGVDAVFVEMYGAGGAGFSIAGVAGSPNTGYGGEAGQYVSKIVEVTPSANIAVTIGTGGAAAGSGLGANGSSTSFGSLFAGGGRSGGTEGDTTLNLTNTNGRGVGRPGQNGVGGAKVNALFGGDGGEGSGGAGSSTTAGAGGIGAGGGAGGTGGNGGDGICRVYWKAD